PVYESIKNQPDIRVQALGEHSLKNVATPMAVWFVSGTAQTPEAPMEGRAESTYRYTVLDTIGGGTSEVQKNIISRRGLGLPKAF
ncbi:MAG: acyl-CoA dehydrogenase family protein, partial [Acidimicrobiia bacterium]|nr:acyl-CoA dehydrogenase family protein [Acidimicrobiia bacterium]